MSTNRFNIDTLIQNQTEAHTYYNKSMYVLDTIVHISAIDRLYDEDSATATTGNIYLIHGGAPASGDLWFSKENFVAYYVSDEWRFVTPIQGVRCYVQDENTTYFYDGNDWVELDKKSINGHIINPEEQNYTLDLSSSSDYKIVEFSGLTTAGQCDIKLVVEGVGQPASSITGVNSSSIQTVDLTSSNILVEDGEKLELKIENVSSGSPFGDCSNLQFSVHTSKN